jgi:hypothetical protein
MPKNDTQVFCEMRFDFRAGENIWTGRNGRADAILRNGNLIGRSPGWCPSEWIDDYGYVDLELSRKHPYEQPTFANIAPDRGGIGKPHRTSSGRQQASPRHRDARAVAYAAAWTWST